MRTVLVIDDNRAVTDALALLFGLHDIETLAAASPQEGLALLRRRRVDLVVADMNFSEDTTSGAEGEALFHALRAQQPDLPVILLTGWTHLDVAVRLIKAGAADYLAKPWDDARLVASVENLLELAEANRQLAERRVAQQQRRAALESQCRLEGLVFASEAMLQLLEMACQVARSALPVLISGPNGAGKERIAGILHANSAVADGPFVAVNCGALPENLLEAELFGAEAGAYTGAARAREGRFEQADGGTLLLDEIGNLPLAGQAKLLRVLETGSFERLGSTRTRSVKVRVLSATNADLRAMVRAGSFREDLYYRLNVIELVLPPLAARRDDILRLAEHFLDGACMLDDAAREALLAHDWPGNVRELRNTLERARLLCRGGVIAAADLALPVVAPAALAPRDLAEPGRAAIEAALEASHGVVARAAQRLGLSRQALYRRLQHYGIGSESD